MDGCYTCRVLHSKMQRARAQKASDATIKAISQEMAEHYAAYHQHQEVENNSEPVHGLLAELWPGTRLAK